MDTQIKNRRIEFLKREIKEATSKMKKYQALRDKAIVTANEEGLEVSLKDFYIRNPDSKFCSCLPKDWEIYEECPELIDPIMRNWEWMIVYYLAAKDAINEINEIKKRLSPN